MIRVFYVPQNKYDGNPWSHQKGRHLYFSNQEKLNAFIEKHFTQPALHHTLSPDQNVKGYRKFVQEYDPLHFNDTATRLFDKNKIDKYPGDDCGGIMGNVLFYNQKSFQ